MIRQRSASLLECLNQLDQTIHILRNTFPMGIRKADDDRDDKLRRLVKIREDQLSTITKAEGRKS